jgi:TonB family protein
MSIISFRTVLAKEIRMAGKGIPFAMAVATALMCQAQQSSADSKILEARRLLAATGGYRAADVALDRAMNVMKPALEQSLRRGLGEGEELENLPAAINMIAEEFLSNARPGAFLDERVAAIYASRLSWEEMRDLADFYESPLGRKFIALHQTAAPEISKEALTWAEQVLQRILNGPEFRARVQAVLKGHPEQTAVAGDAPGSVKINGAVMQGSLIRQTPPQYPAQAKQDAIEGVVRFRAVINTDGTVKELSLISGHPLLAPAAIQAAKRWVYRPTSVDGEPVEVITEIDVRFTLS